MSERFWAAKIRAIIDEVAKIPGFDGNALRQMVPGMEEDSEIETAIAQASSIASSSDRAALETLSAESNRDIGQFEVSHLLSGAKQTLMGGRSPQDLDRTMVQLLESARDRKTLFWALWRSLPEALCQAARDDSVLLIPREMRLPDASIWSHASLTSALAGALVGYNSQARETSHPRLAIFTFTPIQELIKASRKMRDFWAGSWILHYLSARVCWKLAQRYGPDSLVYPSLFQQPLIDRWILKQWPDFHPWVRQPRDRALLTAGFPNVIVCILPGDAVSAAMQTAKQTLLEAWEGLGNKVFLELHENRGWMPELTVTAIGGKQRCLHKTWADWIDRQWQIYWTSFPMGNPEHPLQMSLAEGNFQEWLKVQNYLYNRCSEKQKIPQPEELEFIQSGDNPRMNIGSWWPYLFDRTRFALSTVKNARTWVVPTAFSTRSTVSGIGPAVHSGSDWIDEGTVRQLWRHHAGLFDGREQLNATETVKRGLHKVLLEELEFSDSEGHQDAIAAAYPDLTSGVAGYLKVHENNPKHRQNFNRACQAAIDGYPWVEKVTKDMRGKWGIPQIDEHPGPKKYHPRLLNAGWLVEDADTPELQQLQQQFEAETDRDRAEQLRLESDRLRISYRQGIQSILDDYYPQNNPANWYVLAAGDGDGMSQWLKGTPLKPYENYMAGDRTISERQRHAFEQFLRVKKRMGPSTHNALSRALLDFSNQLLPYLTEWRYAGRLIYGGGDDVLAYTNLWEWDSWLWDIRQCFRGAIDPKKEFKTEGDYWQWQGDEIPQDSPENPLLSARPLFTMGREATISFGIAIAHNSVPLAIALENLWQAEEKAKEHHSQNLKSPNKNAVQVRVLYGNGNCLKSTAKFEAFKRWRSLMQSVAEPAIFEQVTQMWSQHPAPKIEAIEPWAIAFCERRDLFKEDEAGKQKFQKRLAQFLRAIAWTNDTEREGDREIQNWLKLAAFVWRNREIKLRENR